MAPASPLKPLTKEDVADLLSITPRCVEKWVEQGVLPRWKKIGGRSFYHPQVFSDWLEEVLMAPDADEAEGPKPVAATRPKSGSSAEAQVRLTGARRLARIKRAADRGKDAS